MACRNAIWKGPLVADCVQIDNGVLIAGGNIDGQIILRGAQIGDDCNALTGNGLQLSGPFILRRSHLRGDVDLIRSQLGAGIRAENSTIDGNACGFYAESARIDGDFILTAARISAGLSIAAHILGPVDANGSTVSAPQTAIAARSLNVEQGFGWSIPTSAALSTSKVRRSARDFAPRVLRLTAVPRQLLPAG